MGVIYRKKIPYGGGSSETVENYVAGTGIIISEDKVIATKDIKKNYIDNSNFRINQTGATEYSTPNEYTVDRWYIDGGVLTPVENGVQFVNPNTETGASTLVRLRQNIHYGFAEFAGKTLTLSAKINDVIYSATTTIPTEKPTEGTAVQYITAGIADFSINLNYSVTADYFVPYFAVAYSRTALIEWMKLEVNDEFSGYIEPDYMTELIKMNFTTSDKGALDIPTGGESYDDTEIKEDIATLEASVENKLDKDGNVKDLVYNKYTEDFILSTDNPPDISGYNPLELRYGEALRLSDLTNNHLSNIFTFKPIGDKIYVAGERGCIGYFNPDFSVYTEVVRPESSNQMSNLTITDIVQDSDNENIYYLTAMNRYSLFTYNTETNTLSTLWDNTGVSNTDREIYPIRCFEITDKSYPNNQKKIAFISNDSQYIKMTDLTKSMVQQVLLFQDMISDYNEPINHILQWGDTVFLAKGSYLIYWDGAQWINYEEFSNGKSPANGQTILKMYHDNDYLYLINSNGEIWYQAFDYTSGSWSPELDFIHFGAIYARERPESKYPMFGTNDKFYFLSGNYIISSFDKVYFDNYGLIASGGNSSTHYIAQDGYFNNNNKTFYIFTGTDTLYKLAYTFDEAPIQEPLEQIEKLMRKIQELEERIAYAGW